MYLYRTYFRLTACVNDFDEAKQYLSEDDMSVYLKGDTRIEQSVRDAVESIDWILHDESSGMIDLNTNKALSANELKQISDFVKGQNSDGLGEGFSDQAFACYIDEGLTGYDGSDWDNEEVYVTFDDKSNDYIFELISNN